MHHDRTWLLTKSLLLPGIRSLGMLTLAHLHILISVALFLLFLGVLVVATATLGFKVLTTSIGVVFILLFGAGSVISAGHFIVFAFFCFRGGQFSFEALFELNLFSTVIGAVIFDYVGFRLFGGEFGRG